MSDDRAVIFGRDAGAYDTFRPTYPVEVISHVHGLVPANSALEVGAGTGIATELMVRPGLSVVCIEPSEEMASVLRARRLSGVEVDVGTFEDWRGASDSFDLIYAAQSWHWVQGSVGYEKARRLLKPGGILALWWNLSLVRYEPFADVYRQYAPQILEEQDQRIRRRDNPPWLGELADRGFSDLDRFEYKWERNLSASGLRALYSTYSDHHVLPEATRDVVLDAVEAKVVAMGGSMTIPYSTEVFSGRA